MTYEVEKTLHVIERVETHFTDILSNLGGYWSILAVGLIFADFFDDVQMYVVSDLLAAAKEG